MDQYAFLHSYAPDIHSAVAKVLHEKLGEDFVSFEFRDIEVSPEQITMVIEVTLRTRSDADHVSTPPSFFGLTRSVRHAMGEFGQSVFPILRPVPAHT